MKIPRNISTMTPAVIALSMMAAQAAADGCAPDGQPLTAERVTTARRLLDEATEAQDSIKSVRAVMKEKNRGIWIGSGQQGYYTIGATTSATIPAGASFSVRGPAEDIGPLVAQYLEQRLARARCALGALGVH